MNRLFMLVSLFVLVSSVYANGYATFKTFGLPSGMTWNVTINSYFMKGGGTGLAVSASSTSNSVLTFNSLPDPLLPGAVSFSFTPVIPVWNNVIYIYNSLPVLLNWNGTTPIYFHTLFNFTKFYANLTLALQGSGVNLTFNGIKDGTLQSIKPIVAGNIYNALSANKIFVGTNPVINPIGLHNSTVNVVYGYIKNITSNKYLLPGQNALVASFNNASSSLNFTNIVVGKNPSYICLNISYLSATRASLCKPGFYQLPWTPFIGLKGNIVPITTSFSSSLIGAQTMPFNAVIYVGKNIVYSSNMITNSLQSSYTFNYLVGLPFNISVEGNPVAGTSAYANYSIEDPGGGGAPPCTNNYAGNALGIGGCVGSITYSSSTTLVGEVNVSKNVVINSGITLTTNGFNLWAGGNFVNNGIVVTGVNTLAGDTVGCCSLPVAGYGAYGLYVQATNVIIGTVQANATHGVENGASNTISSGGGGGGFVLIAYNAILPSITNVNVSGTRPGAYVYSLTSGGTAFGDIGGNTLAIGGTGSTCTSLSGLGYSANGVTPAAPTVNNANIQKWVLNGNWVSYSLGGAGGGASLGSGGGNAANFPNSYGGSGAEGGAGCTASNLAGGVGGNGQVSTFLWTVAPLSPPPVVSISSITIVNATADQGQNEFVTITTISGSAPYTYAMNVFNTVTGNIITGSSFTISNNLGTNSIGFTIPIEANAVGSASVIKIAVNVISSGTTATGSNTLTLNNQPTVTLTGNALIDSGQSQKFTITHNAAGGAGTFTDNLDNQTVSQTVFNTISSQAVGSTSSNLMVTSSPTNGNVFTWNVISTDIGANSFVFNSVLYSFTVNAIGTARLVSVNTIGDSTQGQTLKVIVSNGIGPFTIKFTNITGAATTFNTLPAAGFGSTSTNSFTLNSPVANNVFTWNAILTDTGATLNYNFNSISNTFTVNTLPKVKINYNPDPPGNGIVYSTPATFNVLVSGGSGNFIFRISDPAPVVNTTLVGNLGAFNIIGTSSAAGSYPYSVTAIDTGTTQQFLLGAVANTLIISSSASGGGGWGSIIQSLANQTVQIVPPAQQFSFAILGNQQLQQALYLFYGYTINYAGIAIPFWFGPLAIAGYLTITEFRKPKKNQHNLQIYTGIVAVFIIFYLVNIASLAVGH